MALANDHSLEVAPGNGGAQARRRSRARLQIGRLLVENAHRPHAAGDSGPPARPRRRRTRRADRWRTRGRAFRKGTPSRCSSASTGRRAGEPPAAVSGLRSRASSRPDGRNDRGRVAAGPDRLLADAADSTGGRRTKQDEKRPAEVSTWNIVVISRQQTGRYASSPARTATFSKCRAHSSTRSSRSPVRSWAAALVLGIGKASGWLDSRTTTVVDRQSPTAAGAGGRPAPTFAAPAPRSTRQTIYTKRSPGVVTIFSTFPTGAQGQGSGFVVSRDGYVLTNAHVITTAPRPAGRAAPPASTSSSRTATALTADRRLRPLFATSASQGRPRRPSAYARCRSATRRTLSWASRWRQSAARSGTRTRSRSASSRRRGARSPSVTSEYELDGRDPDRRCDQPRQLRRPALRRARAA